MKQIVVALGLLLSFQLGAQTEKVTDSLIVKLDELTPFEKSELISIEDRRKALLEQYRNAIQQLDREKANRYTWIADKRGADVSKIVGVQEEEGQLIFKLKKE